MNAFWSAFQSLKVTAANWFRPKNTEPLPWDGGRARPERFRTSFALVHNEHGEEACIGCRICERICPSEIITVTTGAKRPSEATGKPRGWADAFTLDMNACIHCELCIQVCPEDAILMLRVPETPGFTREDLFLTMDKLYANEKFEKSWGTGAKLTAMQEPPKPPPKVKVDAAAVKPKAEAEPAAAAPAEPKPPGTEGAS